MCRTCLASGTYPSTRTDHAGEGDKRHRRRRLPPIGTSFGGTEAAAAWRSKRGQTWHDKHRGCTLVARLPGPSAVAEATSVANSARFLDDRSCAERWAVWARRHHSPACAFTPKIAGGKRTSNPTQDAAVAIWALIFSSSCDLALAGTVARSTDAARRPPPSYS